MGDHRYKAVKRDIQAWRKWIAPNGIMAFHDYGDGTGVPRAIREEILSEPWLWQVISDREYGSIFAVRFTKTEKDKIKLWHEQKQKFGYLRMVLSKNKKLKSIYHRLSNFQ